MYLTPSYHLTPRGIAATVIRPIHWSNLLEGLRALLYAYCEESEAGAPDILSPLWQKSLEYMRQGYATLFVKFQSSKTNPVHAAPSNNVTTPTHTDVASSMDKLVRFI